MVVDETSLRGIWIRQMPSEGDPLFRPTAPSDGRWQRGKVVEGFYLAADEDTAWAEWYRVLAELSIPPMRSLPRDLWRFDINVQRVANLSDGERLARVGLPLPTPNRGEWPIFQSVGEALHAEGWSGVLYPSAARVRGTPNEQGMYVVDEAFGGVEHPPSTHSLVLFRTTALIAGVDPLPPPTRHEEPPPPPRGLQT